MSDPQTVLPPAGRPPSAFAVTSRRLFVRGLVAVLPTLITFWLIVWTWGFLWNNLGVYILAGLSRLVWLLGKPAGVPYLSNFYLETWLSNHLPHGVVQAIGVGLAVLAIYLVGLVAGHLLGRTLYRLAESLLLRLPVVSTIYPAARQITDFLLPAPNVDAPGDGAGDGAGEGPGDGTDRSRAFRGSRVVAVRNHESGIWSIGLFTGATVPGLDAATGSEMVTVFVPSTPTAFTGYVVVVPRQDIVELPMTVEEAMRLLVSGGVVAPTAPLAPTAPVALGTPSTPTRLSPQAR